MKSSQSQVKALTENLRRELQDSQLKLSEITSDVRHTTGEIKRLTVEKGTLDAEVEALTRQNETNASNLK